MKEMSEKRGRLKTFVRGLRLFDDYPASDDGPISALRRDDLIRLTFCDDTIHKKLVLLCGPVKNGTVHGIVVRSIHPLYSEHSVLACHADPDRVYDGKECVFRTKELARIELIARDAAPARDMLEALCARLEMLEGDCAELKKKIRHLRDIPGFDTL